MGRAILIIIILFSIFGSSSGSSSSSSSTSSSSSNSIDKGKQKELLLKYGERDNSKDLLERNKDIIEEYLSGVTSRYYSDSDVFDCFNDICVIEGYFDRKLKNRYDKPKLPNQEWGYNLYNALKKLFKERQDTLEKGMVVGTRAIDIRKLPDSLHNANKEYNEVYSALLKILNQIKVDQYGFYRISDEIKDVDISFLVRYLFDEDDVLMDFGDEYENLPYKDYKQNGRQIIFEKYVEKILKSTLNNENFPRTETSEKLLNNIINRIFGVNKKEENFITYPQNGLYLPKEREVLNNISESANEIYNNCKNNAKIINNKIHGIITKHNNIIMDINESSSKGEILGITKKAESMIEALSDRFCCGYELGYDQDSQILIIEYKFPSIDDLPKIKEYKQTGKDLLYSDTAMKKLYDKYMYSACIKVLYSIYNNDEGFIKGIVFNGIVTSIDKRFGNERTDCILTISTEKEDLKGIILENIDPKETFKALRGVSAASLSSLTPVPPILTLDKNDKRFIEGYNVIDSLNDSVNLACMDWQDFENLIRDLFERIYGEKGGEVKITQASRDGGVDAVAFDPDPITGGKILIQAKRYTNVVGVGAVRDLAGAVHHEGAMKGILVTTSSFGHDAMKFIAKEPISLINGQNLLSLLNKYGYKAHIDIKEARKILKEQEKLNK